MSIAAISRSFSSSALGGLDPIEAPARSQGHRHRDEHQGRRHELVEALSRTLGLDDADAAPAPALFRFAQTLVHDLRELDGGEREGRRHGQHEWHDLPQRLTALAAAARAEPAAAELPDVPNPATPASIAVHMARVPTSHLLEAFVALQRALGREGSEAHARTELAAVADRLAAALQPDAKSELPAGSVLHVTA